MSFAEEQVSLRVYLRNTDKCGWLSAAERLVEQARRDRLAGATVLRGILGLDSTGHLLEPSPLSVVEHVPVIVEVVDDGDRIGGFLPKVDRIAPKSVVTLSLVAAQLYRRREPLVASEARPATFPSGSGGLLPAAALSDEWQTGRVGRMGSLVRVFIGEDALYEGEPLFRAVVVRAQECQSAWAAVLKAPMGYDGGGPLRVTALFHRSRNRPVVVEVVHEGHTEEFLAFLNRAVGEGIVTVEDVWLWLPSHMNQ
jgi:hypothetical protein